ncbi:MAG: hypothetical protein GW798_03885 [Roseovarius sp.]|nr:hypothetical protein [Roseovarius sp.]
MELQESGFKLGGELDAFPGDPSRDVCPVNAIDWNEKGEVAVVDSEICIGCGICAVSCPYGAIHLTTEGKAVVESIDPSGITQPALSETAPHVKAECNGALGTADTAFLKRLPEVVASLSDVQTTRLTRNMFLACGVSANMRRKGDTNVRMDGLLRLRSGQIGVVELETSPNVLESPRALLEDIAVLHNRFGVPMNTIVPVSVICGFPNVRVEYYQVIEDIERVLGVRCRSITLGALCLLMWNFSYLESLGDDLFTTIPGETDLSSSLEKLIGRFENDEPYLGAFKPSK